VTYWDGHNWVPEQPRADRVPARTGRSRWRRGAFRAAAAILLLPALLVPFFAVNAAGPALTASGVAVSGATLSVQGSAFPVRTSIQLRWDGSSVDMPTVRTSRQGSFGTSVTIPALAVPGPHVLSAAVSTSGLRVRAASAVRNLVVSTTVTVLDPAASSSPVAGAPTATIAASTATTAAPTAMPTVPSSIPTAATPTAAPTPTAMPTVLSSVPTAATPTTVPSAMTPSFSPVPLPTWTQAPTAPPVASSVVVRFGPTLTAAELVTAAQNNATDVIELSAGVYRPGIVRLNVDRTRPLLIRPATGATVVFAGGTRPAFYVGLGGVAGDITIQGLVFDGFDMGPDGIVWLGNCHNITVNNMVVRNSKGQAGYSWALYVSTDGGVGPHNVVARNWVVDGGGRTLGGLAIGHTPAAQGVIATGWQVTNASYAIYSNTPATGVSISDWTITSSGLTTFAYLSVVLAQTGGTIRNVHATNSGAPEIEAPMVDSGGNTWK
jgi:hypothetical protein